MTRQYEFSQRPLVADSILGVRAFQVTDDGILTGINHKHPWVEGNNNAVCDHGFGDVGIGSIDPISTGTSLMIPACNYPACSGIFGERVTFKHEVACQKCTCGFYAYFQYETESRYVAIPDFTKSVKGVVEGFGLVTVGSLGFRAAKARIVALISPKPIITFSSVFSQNGETLTINLNDNIFPRIPDWWSPVQLNYPSAKVYSSVAEALVDFPLKTPPQIESAS